MNKKILVIGESCRDVFVYCDTTRLAPDIPVPVLQIVNQKVNPGMAKNVERNIRALYKSCDLVTNENWRKLTKTRYMHNKSNQAFFRVDNDTDYVNSGYKIKRIDVKKIPIEKYDLVAISDYDKGFLTIEDIEYICEHHATVFIDTKKPVGKFLKNAKYIKINNHEYNLSLPIHSSIKNKIIRTKGERGAEFKGKQYPVDIVEVKDSSGAGDSFFAALLVQYVQTNDIEDSIKFANICAMHAVQHRGVSVIKNTK